jgi:hypothetical protein
MTCTDGVIKVWTGDEWEKMACQGCENCLMDEDMPTKSLVDRYAQQAALYAEGIRPTLHPDGSITDGPTSIHEVLEAHTQGDTLDDTSETLSVAPRTSEMPQDVIDGGAQAMTEWVIKQTALAKQALEGITKAMDQQRPIPNRKDKRRGAQAKQRYINKYQTQLKKNGKA